MDVVCRYCVVIFVLTVMVHVCGSRTPNTNIRLVGGATEGRVEVFYNNEWGTVCDDGFDSDAAYVACAMLGLPSSGAHLTLAHGPGNGSIWLDDVRCVGNENSLDSFSHLEWGDNDCEQDEDVGVSCREAIGVDIRLVDAHTSFDGIVELRVNNSKSWRPVCYGDVTDYTVVEAMCRMLGYESPRGVPVCEETRLQGMEPFGFKNMYCSSSVTSIERCRNSGVFLPQCTEGYQGVARISCIPDLDCPVIRHCTAGGLTCIGRNASVCNECEINNTPSTDKLQCLLERDSLAESPVFISGWACAALLLIVVILLCVCYRIRVRKESRKSNINQQEEVRSPSIRLHPIPTAEDQQHTYEIPVPSGAQAEGAYQTPEGLYECVV